MFNNLKKKFVNSSGPEVLGVILGMLISAGVSIGTIAFMVWLIATIIRRVFFGS